MARKIFLVLWLVSVCIFPTVASGKTDDVAAIRQVLTRYLNAKKAYNIETQLDCLTATDRQTIDYLTLKRAQPGELTKALFSRYGKFKIGVITLPDPVGGRKQAVADVTWTIPDYITIGRRYQKIPKTDHLSVIKDVATELKAAGNPQPTLRELLQGEIAKIYHGQPIPMRKAFKKYHLEKETAGWRVEIVEKNRKK